MQQVKGRNIHGLDSQYCVIGRQFFGGNLQRENTPPSSLPLSHFPLTSSSQEEQFVWSRNDQKVSLKENISI